MLAQDCADIHMLITMNSRGPCSPAASVGPLAAEGLQGPDCKLSSSGPLTLKDQSNQAQHLKDRQRFFNLQPHCTIDKKIYQTPNTHQQGVGNCNKSF